MLALIATGEENVACCQPDAVSPVNVTVARLTPVVDHNVPVCTPASPLVL